MCYSEHRFRLKTCRNDIVLAETMTKAYYFYLPVLIKTNKYLLKISKLLTVFSKKMSRLNPMDFCHYKN